MSLRPQSLLCSLYPWDDYVLSWRLVSKWEPHHLSKLISLRETYITWLLLLPQRLLVHARGLQFLSNILREPPLGRFIGLPFHCSKPWLISARSWVRWYWMLWDGFALVATLILSPLDHLLDSGLLLQNRLKDGALLTWGVSTLVALLLLHSHPDLLRSVDWNAQGLPPDITDFSFIP